MKIFKRLPVLDIGEYYLRELSSSDLNDIYEYASDNEVTKWLSFNKHNSINDTKWAYKNIFSKRNNKKLNNSYVIVDKLNNKVIGMCDYADIQNGIPLIGYVLNKKYWGKGIMTKTCKTLIDFGFKLCNINEIVISHISGNIGSEKVIKKVGFTYTYEKEETVVRVKNYRITKEDFYEKS